MTNRQQAYEVRPRKDKRGVDLISDSLPFGRLWCTKPFSTSLSLNALMHHNCYATPPEESENQEGEHDCEHDFTDC